MNQAQKIIELIDLTSLNETDTEETILNLCKQAKTKYGQVAAICIYPKFIKHAIKVLEDLHLMDLPIATVVNFPLGQDRVEDVLAATKKAILDGAREIDVVIPYADVKNGNYDSSRRIVQEVVQLSHSLGVKVKVIIESGELQDADLIYQSSLLAIEEGADFIKTSTGKVKINATLDSAKIMLQAIKDTGSKCGFKAAGGVRTTADALSYLSLARDMLGEDFITAKSFRFGASGLLNDVLAGLDSTIKKNQKDSVY